MRPSAATQPPPVADPPIVPVLAAELAQAPLFGELPGDALTELAAGARRRRFAPGDVVFHEDAPGDALHIVRLGILAVVRPSRDPGLDRKSVVEGKRVELGSGRSQRKTQ